jgi:hypothetical protein
MELTSSVQKLGSIFGTELPQKWARKIFRDDITNFFATRARQNTTTPLYTVKFVILEHQLLTAVAVRSDREEILSDHMEVSSLSPANHHGAAVLPCWPKKLSKHNFCVQIPPILINYHHECVAHTFNVNLVNIISVIF